jgi:formamidopyrimidine-DNA glycosylase
MPELPEVQTIVDDMHAAGLCGATIVDARVFWDRTISSGTVDAFRHDIRGRTIQDVGRRAKFIVITLSGELFCLVHLRMTGRFQFETSTSAPQRHARVALTFQDRRQLVFYDTRKFGRFYLTPSPESVLCGLGPEPLAPDFSAKVLADRIGGRKGRIKPLLLNQKFVAGMGNIYVDEALWTAKIHPIRIANTLNLKEIISLHRAIRHVLRQGIRNAGTALGRGQNNFSSILRNRGGNADHLNVFRRTGQPCPRCGHAIERLIVCQRSTHLCSQCQRIGRKAVSMPRS